MTTTTTRTNSTHTNRQDIRHIARPIYTVLVLFKCRANKHPAVSVESRWCIFVSGNRGNEKPMCKRESVRSTCNHGS